MEWNKAKAYIVKHLENKKEEEKARTTQKEEKLDEYWKERGRTRH